MSTDRELKKITVNLRETNQRASARKEKGLMQIFADHHPPIC